MTEDFSGEMWFQTNTW